MALRLNPLNISIALTAVAYVLMVIFNGLGGAGYKGLFNQNVGQVSNKYSLYITPAGWAFSIWGFIYICLGATVSYCVSTLFRTSPSGQPVYVDPIILSPPFYLLLTSSFILNIIWIFVWNNEMIVAGSIFLLLITYSAWLAVGYAVLRMGRVIDANEKHIIHPEIRLQRILVHNSISIYAMWTTIASLLNINAAFQYFGPYDGEVTSAICCILLLILLIGWFVLENTIFDPDVRYILAQYPVAIFAFGAMLDRQRKAVDPIPQSVSALTWALLAVSIILFVSRLAIVNRRRSMRSSNISLESLPANHGTFATD